MGTSRFMAKPSGGMPAKKLYRVRLTLLKYVVPLNMVDVLKLGDGEEERVVGGGWCTISCSTDTGKQKDNRGEEKKED